MTTSRDASAVQDAAFNLSALYRSAQGRLELWDVVMLLGSVVAERTGTFQENGLHILLPPENV